MANSAARNDRAANLSALDALNRVALPAARIAILVADRVEAGSSDLVRRVAGNLMPAKAVAAPKPAQSGRPRLQPRDV